VGDIYPCSICGAGVYERVRRDGASFWRCDHCGDLDVQDVPGSKRDRRGALEHLVSLIGQPVLVHFAGAGAPLGAVSGVLHRSHETGHLYGDADLDDVLQFQIGVGESRVGAMTLALDLFSWANVSDDGGIELFFGPGDEAETTACITVWPNPE
jgi:hypothetical protein